MNRREFLKVGVITISGAALGGCVVQPVPVAAPQQQQQEEPAAESGTVVFWQPIDNHYSAFDYFGSKIPDFQENHPNVEVE